jgi:hypothetical protein
MKNNKKFNIIKYFVIFILIVIFLFFIHIFFYSNKYKIETFNETRNAYLLTCNENSERTKFSIDVLEKIGFNVIIIKCLFNENKVLSNKESMMSIYNLIINGQDDWAYVFEDDINILEDIKIEEIIKYEKISDMFFYLGLCVVDTNNPNYLYSNEEKINNNDVKIVKGNIRGLHSIGISKKGVNELLSFSNDYKDYEYMDMILEKFSEKYPANVVRFDLESYIPGHRGICFQDRDKFQSTI